MKENNNLSRSSGITLLRLLLYSAWIREPESSILEALLVRTLELVPSSGRVSVVDKFEPVREAVSVWQVAAEHELPHQIAVSDQVVVGEDSDLELDRGELLSARETEDEGLVPDGVQGVAFSRRPFLLRPLSSAEESHSDEGICKKVRLRDCNNNVDGI